MHKQEAEDYENTFANDTFANGWLFLQDFL